ncbi:MAG: (deoxy)nucleoside triphosphate pyrophosphohydrolase [Candidatus Izemoplasmatales bacterium]
MKTVEVVAAIIQKDNKILCTQRADDGRFLSLKWEFPGGKIEENETHQEALKREIQEELKLDIDVNDYLMTVDHVYPHFRIIMHAYLCKMNHSVFSLEEHNNFKWLEKTELTTLDWAEADIPIVKQLIEGK